MQKADLGYNVSFTGNDQYKASAPFETVLTGGQYGVSELELNYLIQYLQI